MELRCYKPYLSSSDKGLNFSGFLATYLSSSNNCVDQTLNIRWNPRFKYMKLMY